MSSRDRGVPFKMLTRFDVMVVILNILGCH